MKNATRNSLVLVVFLLFGMAVFSCVSSRHNNMQPLAPGVQAQLDALQTPDGVDAQLFAQLKDAFTRALETQGKTTAAAPSGPANAPASPGFADLGGGDFQLVWFYRNIGDYDQSGTVGVTDITPLAVHFGHNGVDGIDSIIDGDHNGVGISDVTPIAQNFGVNFDHYEIEWSTAEAGPSWTSMASLPLADGADKASGWMRFAHTAAYDPAHWYRITPFDAQGNPGQSSAPIQTTTTSQIPSIVSITPNTGLASGSATFNAVIVGVPDSYSWDFGGAANPNTSTEASPTVTLGTTYGTYTVSLDVSNAYGNDSYEYLFQIVETGDPPDIVLVTPTSGAEGDSVQFAANITGGSINTIEWNFGGGATPNISTDASPTVTLGIPGDYSASVTATNAFGDDTYGFTLHITAAWNFHLIEAGPYVGQQSAFCIAEGVPMAAYIEEWDKRVRYARANVAMPTQSSDWTLANVSTKTDTWGGNLSIAEVGGHVAILANKSTAQKAQYFYELNCPAAEPADWVVCEIGPSAIEVGTLAEVDGMPAVSYYNGDMIYAEASSLAPTVLDDWTKVTVDSAGFVGANSKLVVNEGNPYMLYRDTTEVYLRLAYVDVADRLDPGAWVTANVDEGKKAGEYNDIAFSGDNILIGYSREPQDIEMHFAIGPKMPTGMGSFQRTLVDSAYQEDIGGYASIAAYNNNVWLAYTNADEIDLKLAHGTFLPDQLPAAWDIGIFDDGGGAGAPLINGDTHMLVWNNTLMLIYRRNDGLWFCSLPLT